jgi:hypothetical protein
VIAADAQAEVYVAPETPEYPEKLALWGCTRNSRRSHLLGGLGGFGSQGGESTKFKVLAGSVAVVEYFAAVGSEQQRVSILIEVTDLRTGRVLHRVPAGGRVVDAVARGDGAAAWMTGENERQGHEVRAVDRAGNRMLAAGADINPFSLALAGSTLYWTQGGVPMSAALN